FCLVNIHDHSGRHHVLTWRIDQFNMKLLVVDCWSFNDCRCCLLSLLIQYAWIAVAVWTFLTWLGTAVTTWHCLLWLLFIVLNIILLRWLVVMLTARITLVFTCFMTLLLTRDLNHFFMHLMLLRSGSFRLNLLTRFFVLRIAWFFVVMTRRSFITLCRFFSI